VLELRLALTQLAGGPTEDSLERLAAEAGSLGLGGLQARAEALARHGRAGNRL
jgi:hypothetical protein